MTIRCLRLALLPLACSLAAQEPEHDVPVDLPRSPPLPAAQSAAAVQGGFAAVARAVWPSVVTVRAYVRETAAPADGTAAASAPAAGAAVSPVAASASGGWLAGPAAVEYPGFRLAGVGSGFVVSADGEILTCNHVLRGPDGRLADLVEVETNDLARILADVIGAEPTVNLAILKASVFPNGFDRKLAPLTFGDSEALECGHWTLGFGDPDGVERFCAPGTFIAHPNRDCYQDLLSSFFMQVAMVAHPQAYGGPLIDLAGNVVGVLAPRQPSLGVWAPSARMGIEFALPSKIVAGLYSAIRQVGSTQSPWLGLAVMSRPELAKVRGLAAFEQLAKPRSGILIENVFDPSPAFAAGIRPGDWLVTFGAKRVFTPVDFQRCLYLTGIGGAAKLELWREGETLQRELRVELRPAAATPR